MLTSYPDEEAVLSAIIAQDEASCVIYGMPKAAVDAGVADAVVPLNAIAGRISAIVKGGR